MMEISQRFPYGWFQYGFCLRTDLQLYHILISFNRAIWLQKSNKYIRTIKKMVDALFKKQMVGISKDLKAGKSLK